MRHIIVLLLLSLFLAPVQAGTYVTTSPLGGSSFGGRTYSSPFSTRTNGGFNRSTPHRVYNSSPYYNNSRLHNNNHRRYLNSPQKRIYRQNQNFIPRTSFSDMNALEKYALNRNYGRESDLERIERLEMQTFGAIQGGDISSRYENVRGAILSRPKQNFKTSLLRNLGNYLSGQTTGFTPGFNPGFSPSFTSNSFSTPSFTPSFSSNMMPMSGFSTTPYPTTAGNSSVTQYSGPWGSGYRINTQSTGSSTGVTILD